MPREQRGFVEFAETTNGKFLWERDRDMELLSVPGLLLLLPPGKSAMGCATGLGLYGPRSPI